MSRALTQKQADVLSFIARTVDSTGKSPSLVSIGQEFGGISLPSVEKHIEALVKKGYIARRRHQRPPFILLHSLPEQLTLSPTMDIPLVGVLQAASPIQFCQPPYELVTVEAGIAGRSHATVALRVEGFGLVGEALLPGDLLVVRPGKLFASGETVVVLVNGGATVKRVAGTEGEPMLLSVQPAGEPLNSRDMDVYGVVLAVQRRLAHGQAVGQAAAPADDPPEAAGEEASATDD